MSMAIDQRRLVWLDMEMTGLDPQNDHIIEVAMVITDSELETIAESPVFVIHQSDEILAAKLTEAKDIYYSVYNLNKDYYPALNYIYLQFMLAHINNDNLDTITNEAKNIWSKTNHKITDWWSFISNIEFLILVGQYEDAKDELNNHFDVIRLH
jgi:DNA polymerase III alpha subunit (gram-positive type)